MPQHEEIEIKAPVTEQEFDAELDEADPEVVQAQAMSRSMQGIARNVSLDPGDEMDL